MTAAYSPGTHFSQFGWPCVCTWGVTELTAAQRFGIILWSVNGDVYLYVSSRQLAIL